MVSQELGLILGHELLDLDELHFGMWDSGLAVSLANLPVAQRRFTDYLLARLPRADAGRVLDAGCGTGVLMERLIAGGYGADGMSPSAQLNALARSRLEKLGGHDARIFDCRLEDAPTPQLGGRYDTVVFSESFQFVKIDAALGVVASLLRPGGHLVICDMFKSGRQGDGEPGDGVIRGGQSLAKFRALAHALHFRPVDEEDITEQVAPTIDLVAELLERRAAPAVRAVDAFLSTRHPLAWRIARCVVRGRFRGINERYFTGLYNRPTFERYKTYRFLKYRLEAA